MCVWRVISGRLALCTYLPIRSTIYLSAGWRELSIDKTICSQMGWSPTIQVISLFYAITISPPYQVSIKKCSTSQSPDDWVRRKRPIKGSDSIDDDGDAASRCLSIYSYWQTVGTTSTWSVSQSAAQESLPEIFLWPPSYKNVTNFIIRMAVLQSVDDTWNRGISVGGGSERGMLCTMITGGFACTLWSCRVSLATVQLTHLTYRNTNRTRCCW